jgi:acetyl esterase/lipase
VEIETMKRTALVLSAWLACFAALTAQKAPDVTIEKDIVYARPGDVALQLDLARPTSGKGPFPLVVCLHGGAWQIGHRAAHHRTIRLLARHGYVAATVSYRLAPKHRFPAQIEDAKAAVRYLRSRAKELNIDPTKVGALGDSAGGHLALLLGLTDPKDGLEGSGADPKLSSKVRAVVNFYGPTDLRTWKPTPAGEKMLRTGLRGKGGDDLLRDACGTADRKSATVARMSPLTYVDRRDPPVLTLQGSNDDLVPLSQAKRLHEALKKAGVAEKLVVLEGQGHGWGGKERDRTDRLMLGWFDKYLKGK